MCALTSNLDDDSEMAAEFAPDGDPVSRLGDYTLLSEIARGGMGVVYRARQEALRRMVAVKILPGAAFSSPEFRQRFQREAETAARLQHPGIVAIHEVGTHLGQPFIAMELIEGPSLAVRLQQGRMTSDLAAHVIRQVALAVAHAHERGVVHRDLKPANILLRHDTEPVLTDFGLARLTQSGATLTLPGASVGSPGYMPPERISAPQASVSAATAEDIYGLGAVLYHCLSGRPPFVAESMASLLDQTQREDPLPPRMLNPSVPMDLQTICLRCLEKSPSQRYAKAEEVAAELDRFLKNEPILARPISLPQQLWRRARRKPVIAVLIIALVLAIGAGTTAALLGWNAAANQAEIRRVSLYSSDVTVAAAAMNEGHPARARSLLAQSMPAPGQTDLRGPEWFLLHYLLTPQETFSCAAHRHILTGLAWHEDGQRLLSCAHDGSLCLWRCDEQGHLTGGTQLLPPGTPRLHQVEWLPGELSYLASEERKYIRARQPSVREPLWQVPGQIFSLAASVHLLAVSTAGPFYYDPAGQVQLWQLQGSQKPRLLEIFPGAVRAIALSPDGRFLACARAGGKGADDENGVWLHDLQHREQAPRLLPTPGAVWTMRFSPDSQKLAVLPFLSGSVEALRYESATGRSLASISGGLRRSTSVTFTDDSRQLILASTDRSLHTWSADHATVGVTAAHENEIWSSALQPQQKWLATGDKDGVLKIFQFPLPASHLSTLPRYAHYRYAPLIFSRDSMALMPVSKAMNGRAQWQPLGGGEARALDTHDMPVGMDAAGNILEWHGDEQRLHGPKQSWTLPALPGPNSTHHPLLGGQGTHFALIASDGSAQRLTLQSGTVDTVTRLLERPSGEDEYKVSAISEEGRYIALATWHELALYDFATGTTRRFSNDPHWARDIAFSYDGRLMATAGIDGNIHLRRLPEGELIATLKGHIEEASALTFSPDGKTLVSSELGHGLRFWRLDTLREVLHLPLPDAGDALRFSPDGRHLAVTVFPQGAAPEAASVMILPVH